MESLVIMNRTTRSKKLEVKGGFYSKEDMKNELSYSQPPESTQDWTVILKLTCLIDCPVDLVQPFPWKPKPRSRIEKIAAWAEKKGLVRPLGVIIDLSRSKKEVSKTPERHDRFISFCSPRKPQTLKERTTEIDQCSLGMYINLLCKGVESKGP